MTDAYWHVLFTASKMLVKRQHCDLLACMQPWRKLVNFCVHCQWVVLEFMTGPARLTSRQRKAAALRQSRSAWQ